MPLPGSGFLFGDFSRFESGNSRDSDCMYCSIQDGHITPENCLPVSMRFNMQGTGLLPALIPHRRSKREPYFQYTSASLRHGIIAEDGNFGRRSESMVY